MDGLKPCPTCGKETGTHRKKNGYHILVCENCGYRTPPCPDYTCEDDPESIATIKNYWNHGVKW